MTGYPEPDLSEQSLLAVILYPGASLGFLAIQMAFPLLARKAPVHQGLDRVAFEQAGLADGSAPMGLEAGGF